MPKVRLSFEIRGWVTQQVEVPQEVIDSYDVEVEKDNPDCEKLDNLLAVYISYDNLMEQLDDPEEIELTQIKE